MTPAKLKPYLSVDLETSGLDTRCSQILEVAAVYDDGVSPIEQLPRFNVILKQNPITYAEPIALVMNVQLLAIIGEQVQDPLNRPLLHPEEAAKAFEEFLKKVSPDGKVDIAGKNVGKFDLQLLKNEYYFNEIVEKYFGYRIADPGSMFFEYFGRVPGQGEINQMIGRPAVRHQGLEDCIDVVTAIRWKMGIK